MRWSIPSLFSRPKTAAKKRVPHRNPLRLELLEDRLTPANVVLDFESLRHVASLTYNYPTYSEDGFNLTSNEFGYGVVGTQSSQNAGSTTLYEETGNALTTLRKEGRGAFEMQSIDLARRSNFGFSVTFTGTLGGGGTVSQTITVPGGNFPLVLQTF